MAPILRHREERFRCGDAVYQAIRKPDLQPNGYIKQINWSEQTVTVKYYDDPNTEDIDWEELEGTWTDKFGGLYYLEDANEEQSDAIIRERIKAHISSP